MPCIAHKGASYGILGNDRETIKCFEKFVEFAPPKYQYQVKEIEQLLIQLK